jgi:hypothetical protein
VRMFPADQPDLKVLPVELHLFCHGALGTEPNHFLLDVRRQAPSPGIRHWQREDFARAESLELSFAHRVSALA